MKENKRNTLITSVITSVFSISLPCLHIFHLAWLSKSKPKGCPDELPQASIWNLGHPRLEKTRRSSRLQAPRGSWLILIAFNARVAKDITSRGNRKQVTRPCRIESSKTNWRFRKFKQGHSDVRVDGGSILDPCGPKVGEVTGYSFPITSARRSLKATGTDKYWHDSTMIWQYLNQIQSNDMNSTKFTMKPDMALISVEVLWLQQNTMIQACNSSAIVARTSPPGKKTEVPKST